MQRFSRSVLKRAACAMAIALVAGAFMCPAPLQAQGLDASQSAPFEYVSRGNGRVIRTQVEIAIRAAEMAVSSLGPGLEVDELNRAKDLAYKSYVLLRYAASGIELVLNDDQRTSAEKLVGRMALASIQEARDYNIAARQAIDNSIPWPESREEYVGKAIHDLNESLPRARKAVMLLILR